MDRGCNDVTPCFYPFPYICLLGDEYNQTDMRLGCDKYFPFQKNILAFQHQSGLCYARIVSKLDDAK